MIPVVILAAGKSTRIYPLGLTTPKAVIKIANKEIIKHVMDNYIEIASKFYVIVNYLKDKIIENLGNNYKGIPIEYVLQEEINGTGGALMLLKDKIKDDIFIVSIGDDVYSTDKLKLKELINKKQPTIFVSEHKNPRLFGVCETKDNYLVKIHEKPENPPSNLVNTAVYLLTKNIFDYLNEIKMSKRNELELTDAVSLLSNNQKVLVYKMDFWFPITYPWHIIEANHFILERIKSNIKGNIEENVHIKGEVIIGKNTIIKSGCYIEGNVVIGDNCKIGPNCYIRGNTTIGNNCHIGQAVEIKNSVIFDNTNVAHLSYVGDSVLGNHVNFGAGTIVANLRHDNSNVKSFVKQELIDTQRRKFGTIVGDNVHTGIHTSILPGRKIWPNQTTYPCEIVNKDKM